MKRKIFLGILIGAIILIPLGINFIIQCPAWFPIIGTSVDWLAFWGCYLGGVAAAFVGFATLYNSARRQKIELLIQYKQMELRDLSAKLSKSVSTFDYSRLCAIVLYINEPSKYNEIIADLEQYDHSLIEESNSLGLLYANKHETTSPITRFMQCYGECVEIFNINIMQLNIQIAALRDTIRQHNIKVTDLETNSLTKEIYKELTNISQQQNMVNSKLKTLFLLAQTCVEQEEKKLSQLSNQL